MLYFLHVDLCVADQTIMRILEKFAVVHSSGSSSNSFMAMTITCVWIIQTISMMVFIAFVTLDSFTAVSVYHFAKDTIPIPILRSAWILAAVKVAAIWLVRNICIAIICLQEYPVHSKSMHVQTFIEGITSYSTEGSFWLFTWYRSSLILLTAPAWNSWSALSSRVSFFTICFIWLIDTVYLVDYQ